MSEADPLFCFVDTNILIQFQTFDEVDWADKLQSPFVRLMLAPAVLSEIDKFKDDHTNGRRRSRVRMILAKLRELLNGTSEARVASLGSHTTLAVIDYEPQLDWTHHRLDPMIGDDRLIASILEFQQDHDSIKVVLLTDDFPLELKARRHDIVCRKPEGMLARLESSSPEGERIRTLERELAELRLRIPELTLGFLEARTSTQHVKRPLGMTKRNRPTDDLIARRIACMRRQLDKEVLSAPKGYFGQVNVKEFKETYAHYLVNMEVLLKRRRAREFDWRYELSFELGNSGTAPAEDIEITLNFPSGSFVVALEDEHDEYDGLGKLQVRRPVPDWKRVHDKWPILGITRQEPWSITYPEHYEPATTPSGPLYFDDRSRISYQHPKLRAQEQWQMPAVAAYIPPIAGGGFNISYVIHADQLAKPIENQLHVRFDGIT